MGLCAQRHTPAVLPPGKRLGTFTGGWVDPRADVGLCRKFHPTGILSSDRLARSELLYRLSYSDTYNYIQY